MVGSIFLVAVEGHGVPTSTELHSQMLSSAPVLNESIQIKNNPFVTVFVFFTIQVPRTTAFPKIMQLQIKGHPLQHQHGWVSKQGASLTQSCYQMLSAGESLRLDGLGNQLSLKSAVVGSSQDLGDSIEPNCHLVKTVVVAFIFRDSSWHDTQFYNIQYQKASSSCPATVSTAPLTIRRTSTSLPAGLSWKRKEGRCVGQDGNFFILSLLQPFIEGEIIDCACHYVSKSLLLFFGPEIRREGSLSPVNSQKITLLLQSPAVKFITNPEFFTVLHANYVSNCDLLSHTTDFWIQTLCHRPLGWMHSEFELHGSGLSCPF